MTLVPSPSSFGIATIPNHRVVMVTISTLEGLKRRRSTMRRFTLHLVIFAVLGLGTAAKSYTQDINKDQQDLKNDKTDLKKDRQDISSDQKDLNKDRADRNKDTRD